MQSHASVCLHDKVNQNESPNIILIMARQRKYRSFKDARKWARSSGIKSSDEWEREYEAGRIPLDIPKHPDYEYADKETKKLYRDVASKGIDIRIARIMSAEF